MASSDGDPPRIRSNDEVKSPSQLNLTPLLTADSLVSSTFAKIIDVMKNLRLVPIEELQEQLAIWQEPKFRAKQIQEWLWKKQVRSISEMTNLSLNLREKLSEIYHIPTIKVDLSQYSEDGTIKNRLRLPDGHIIESVLIPTETRMTACVSSQAGCGLSCKFCATGYLKKGRDVHFDEIVEEVTMLNELAQKEYGRHLSNIVFMGMGEPLLNYKNVMKAIKIITSPDGLGMSSRRITVSTSGIAKLIKRMGDEGLKFKLALSLHAADNETRSKIMPINDSNNIESLVEALNYFYQKTKNPITLEYILFKNLNDSLEAAKNLVRLYRQMPAELVNVIEYNPIDQADFEKPDEASMESFLAYLTSHGVNARLRRSRGKDIDAGCGQLANINREASGAAI